MTKEIPLLLLFISVESCSRGDLLMKIPLPFSPLVVVTTCTWEGGASVRFLFLPFLLLRLLRFTFILI